MGTDEEFRIYGKFTVEEKVAILRYQLIFWKKKAKKLIKEREVIERMMEETIELKDDAEKALEGAAALERRNEKIFKKSIRLLAWAARQLDRLGVNHENFDRIQEFLNNQDCDWLIEEVEKSKKGGGREEDDNQEPIVI